MPAARMKNWICRALSMVAITWRDDEIHGQLIGFTRTRNKKKMEDANSSVEYISVL